MDVVVGAVDVVDDVADVDAVDDPAVVATVEVEVEADVEVADGVVVLDELAAALFMLWPSAWKIACRRFCPLPTRPCLSPSSLSP